MSRFVPSPIFDPVAQEAARAHRMRLAEEIVAGARRSNNDDTGHYDRSLHTFDDKRGIGAQTDDVGGHVIEYGSIHHEPQAPMRTAAANAGRFDPRPR